MADINRAVESAVECHSHWASLSYGQRCDLITSLTHIIETERIELANLEGFDCGRLASETIEDIDECVKHCRYVVDYFTKFKQDTPVSLSPNDSTSYEVVRRFEPFGVVGLITPWNFPLMQIMFKLIPALAAGNCVVLKPSEYASLSAIRLAEMISSVGFPKGVFNLLTGEGSVGDRLVRHPSVRLVSFTGSVSTGSKVMQAAAAGVKPVVLELGGKSPMIVFNDADVEATADWIISGIFSASGQVCSATSRVLIQDGLYGKMCEAIKKRTAALKIGPYWSDADVGPIVSEAQYNKVMGFIKLAQDENLSLLVKGERSCVSEEDKGGYYIQPRVYYNVPTTSTLWVQEIFGPVLCIRSFTTEREGVEMANQSDMGLAGAVMGKDEDQLRRVANALKCGMVWVNCSQPLFQQHSFGGFKMSGFGRECGDEGMMEFLQSKAITRKK
eukprot:GHVN01047175.1.p1 GENE.GHVN01047175.1~~GHVN01047175.1.p1  ORF type:complete len:444 (+),score=87.59 GHVN01047175.1:239-1570(+)